MSARVNVNELIEKIQRVKEYIDPILKNEGVTEYDDSIKFLDNSGVGFGYMNEVIFVQIDASERIYNFAIKCAKKDEKFREALPIGKMFENEIFAYTELIPHYTKLQIDRRINSSEIFDNKPECYRALGADRDEFLVLEDLTSDNYCLWDKRKPLDLTHTKAILKIIGKYHALSFAMRDQKPELFQNLCAKAQNLLPEYIDDNLAAFEPPLFSDIIEIARNNGYFELAEKVTILQDEIKDLKHLLEPDSYAVIAHGDCWINNFMFKYDDASHSTPSKIRILDWQVVKLISPIYDLSYFLFSSLNPDFLHDNFDELNSYYHENLSTFLSRLGSDPAKLFPSDELTKQWKKYAKFGLVMMPVILKLCLHESDEIIDFAEDAKSGENAMASLGRKPRNIAEYGRRALGVLKFAAEREFI